MVELPHHVQTHKYFNFNTVRWSAARFAPAGAAAAPSLGVFSPAPALPRLAARVVAGAGTEAFPFPRVPPAAETAASSGTGETRGSWP